MDAACVVDCESQGGTHDGRENRFRFTGAIAPFTPRASLTHAVHILLPIKRFCGLNQPSFPHDNQMSRRARFVERLQWIPGSGTEIWGQFTKGVDLNSLT